MDKFADINLETDLNDINKYEEGAFIKLEDYLVTLASLTNIQQNDDLDDQKYESIKDSINLQNNQVDKKQYWNSGTGYGHQGCKTWNIETYLKSQEEKDKQIIMILKNIILEIQNSDNEETILYNTIQYSYLIPYIKSLLNSVTLIEIQNHVELYNIVFTLLASLATDDSIQLFYDKEKDLFSLIEELNNVCNLAVNLDKNNVDNIINTIMILYSMIKIPYDKYKEKMMIIEKDHKKEEEIKLTEIENYAKELVNIRFGTTQIINSVGQEYHYKKLFESGKLEKISYQTKLIREVTTLQQSLPVHYNASIFLRIDTDNMSTMRVLMTGPEGTPYDSGCFLFDVYIPNNYPNVPPNVWFITHYGKRFNYNLYDSGKVCLSILGTWNGEGSEKWNNKTSTLHQVFISIQSLILSPDCAFNEPGYEKHINTPIGEKMKKEYNNKIRMYTMCHAIRDIMKDINLYSQFTEVIRKHFTLKKKYILELCEKWTNECEENFTYKKNNYQDVLNEIKLLIETF